MILMNCLHRTKECLEKTKFMDIMKSSATLQEERYCPSRDRTRWKLTLALMQYDALSAGEVKSFISDQTMELILLELRENYVRLLVS